MQACYANFTKSGDPNGTGLPVWPHANEGAEMHYMVWDVQPQVVLDQNRARYILHEQLNR